MTRIMQDAARVLDALDEGIVCGVIMYLEHHNPHITKDGIKEGLIDVLSKRWPTEKIQYWIDWFGFNKKDRQSELV